MGKGRAAKRGRRRDWNRSDIMSSRHSSQLDVLLRCLYLHRHPHRYPEDRYPPLPSTTTMAPKNAPGTIDVSNLDNSTSPLTPKTPAEEGLEFFGSAVKPGEGPIRVYELRLGADGGPSKDLQVRRHRSHLAPITDPLSSSVCAPTSSVHSLHSPSLD